MRLHTSAYVSMLACKHAYAVWRLTYSDVCWRMLTYADVCWRMLTYADVCWRMLTYADVCWRMLTYADVCWRMLTYTDVCTKIRQICWRLLKNWFQVPATTTGTHFTWFTSTKVQSCNKATTELPTRTNVQHCRSRYSCAAQTCAGACSRMLCWRMLCWRSRTWAHRYAASA
jgi:hypothetical protein